MKTPYQEAVEMFGKDEAAKMWQRAVDPNTGYIARDLNTVGLLDGKTPCQRCGGLGLWGPVGGASEVLCLQCHDEWGEVAPKLLRKHGYVWSKKKWHAAFQEFCSTKPWKVDVAKHNQEVTEKSRAIKAAFPEYFC